MGDPSCVKDGSLDWSGHIALLEPSFEESYSDGVVVSATTSTTYMDPICTDSFDLTPISSPCFHHPLLFACLS